MIDDLGVLAPDRSQLAIRARILAGMPTDEIRQGELRQLLSDFNALPARSRDDDDIDETGSLVSLSIALRRSPRADLFDDGIGRVGNRRQHKSEVQSLLNQALVAAIGANTRK